MGYPLSVRGQVRRAQGPLPCVAATVLCSWRLSSLGRVPMSSVPRRRRYYEGATTSHPASRSLLVRDRVPRGPPRFVLAEALPGGWRSRPSLGREPYRVFWRLLILEGWSHDQAHTPV